MVTKFYTHINAKDNCYSYAAGLHLPPKNGVAKGHLCESRTWYSKVNGPLSSAGPTISWSDTGWSLSPP